MEEKEKGHDINIELMCYFVKEWEDIFSEDMKVTAQAFESKV